MTHIDPNGNGVTISPQKEGCAIVFVQPGITAITQPGQFIVYPEDMSLPYIVENLSGFEEI